MVVNHGYHLVAYSS